jgi:GNAT superfamily N-acetyltransferase
MGMLKDLSFIQSSIENYLKGLWGEWDMSVGYKDYKKEIETRIGGGFTFEVKRREFSFDVKLWDLGGEEISSFTITFIQGSRHLVVFEQVKVAPVFQGKGLGDLLHKMRLGIARSTEAKIALCTCREENIPQVKILKNNGWVKVMVVKETEWVHDLGDREYLVGLWRKELRQ